MKTTKILITMCLAVLLAGTNLNAQVKIGGAAGDTPYDQAILELESAAKGLRLPQLTNAQRNALVTTNATKAKGLMIFNTETNCVEVYNNGGWFAMCDNQVKVVDCSTIKAFTINGITGSVVNGAVIEYQIDQAINPRATYTWTVTGTTNSFIGSTTGNVVSVKWKEAGTLTATAYGCTSNKATAAVTVQACNPASVPTFKYQAKNPYKGGTYTYEVNAIPGATDYAWTVTNGTITEGQGTSRVRVLFSATGATTVKVKVALGDCQLNEVVAAVNPVSDDKADYTGITNGGAVSSTTNPTTYASTYTDKGTITDGDGNTYTVKEYYKWVYNGVNTYTKTNRQIWMTQNLATYVTGVKMNLGGAKSSGISGENNGYDPTGKVSTLSKAMQDSAKSLGFIYTWNLIMDSAEGNIAQTDPSTSRLRGICPAGWSIPSDRDWTDLEWLLSRQDYAPIYVSGGTGATSTDYSMWTSIWETGEISGYRNPDESSADPSKNGIGTSMKLSRSYATASGSTPPTSVVLDANNGIAYTQRNSTGFNAVLSGTFYSGQYREYGSGAHFWTSSLHSNKIRAWRRTPTRNSTGIYRGADSITSIYFSARCIKKP